MGKTTLTNNVGFNVQVKEGSSNIFRVLNVLKPGMTMTIKADPSATYREYVLIVLPDNKKLRALSSDDIQELTAVEIFKDEKTGEVDWKELPGGAGKKGLVGSIFGWFFPNSGPKADAKAGANAESSNSSTAPQ